MISDILFIGAGFSNLAAANKLQKAGKTNFVILEKGKAFNQRYCLGEKEYTCRKCHLCDTLEGVGGANALHGNKLCYFPASQHITENMDENLIQTSLNDMSVLLKHSFTPEFNLFSTRKRKKQPDFEKKKYFSESFMQADFAAIARSLIADIAEKIIPGQCVSEIRKQEGYYLLRTTTGETYMTRQVVIGTGRSSYLSLKKMLESIGAVYHAQCQDIGIRIEANSESFTPAYTYQEDPKLKFDFGEWGSTRTFCAHNHGKVVPVRLGNAFFADGAFGASRTHRNNIAVMVRTRHPLTDDEIEKWCQAINEQAGQQLVLGQAILRSSGNVLKKILPVFPTATHAWLMEKTLNQLLSGEQRIISENAKITVYGPAVDLQWCKPELNADFSLPDDENIFILGDATGKSRGFVQALFSGVTWANLLIKNKMTTQNKEKWLNLV